MTSLASASLAASWLGLVSLFFWWQRALQVAHERELIAAHNGSGLA
jgi:hypothetical protein